MVRAKARAGKGPSADPGRAPSRTSDTPAPEGRIVADDDGQAEAGQDNEREYPTPYRIYGITDQDEIEDSRKAPARAKAPVKDTIAAVDEGHLGIQKLHFGAMMLLSILIVIAGIGFAMHYNLIPDQIIPSRVQQCPDGTKLETCSTVKPRYCTDEGDLVDDSARCGCPPGTIPAGGSCTPITCGDLKNGSCSEEKPLYCFEGSLVRRPSVCGCPLGKELFEEDCVPLRHCKDGTEYGACSEKKPAFCLDGALINKASVCGCPPGDKYPVVPVGENCVLVQ